MRKSTVSLTMDAELRQQAKIAGLNLSALLTVAVESHLKELEQKQWVKDNHAGLEELNRITDEHGLLSDKYRSF